jgi:acetoacetate decarboxylase
VRTCLLVSSSSSSADLPGGPQAPLVPPFPIRFRDVLVLTAFYRTEPDAIERLLPAPLRRVGEIVALHIYRMGDVDHMGALGECNLMVGAELDRAGGVLTGGFTVAQFITSDVGLAHGREVHGQPKKLARIALEARDDLVVGTVERNGIEVITSTLPYKQRRAEPGALTSHFDFTLNFNLKTIQHIDGTPAICELTGRRLEAIDLQECWVGPCTVELRPNAQAPVWRLPVIEPLEGFLWRTEFTLTGGERLHDYLAAREYCG